MKNLKEIVVGVDFSECSKTALAQAGRIAAAHAARLHVLHIIDSLAVSDLIEATRSPHHQLREKLTGELTEKLKKICSDINLPESPAIDVRVGLPIAEILDKVQETSADLLVLGAQGSSGDDKKTGELATLCVRKVPCRIMLVRQKHAGPFKTVVAGVDFSENSVLAVGEAIDLAKRDKAALKLLHVYAAPWHRLNVKKGILAAEDDAMREYRASLESRLNYYREFFKNKSEGLDIKPELREHSSHGTGIIKYLNEINADIVVLGKRGRSNLAYILLGSTAEKVIRETPCSVLAINPGNIDHIVPDSKSGELEKLTMS